MKKTLVFLFVFTALSVILCTGALADDVYGYQTPVFEQDIQNVTITPDEQNPEILNVTYSAAQDGKQYMIFMLSSGEVPTSENIEYINQEAANGSVSFKVYPKTLKKQTYSIYISTDAETGITGYTKIATIEYKPAYILGDVNNDGIISPNDRTMLARHIAKWKGYETVTSPEAADIDGNGIVTPNDRTILARYLAKWKGYENLDSFNKG